MDDDTGLEIAPSEQLLVFEPFDAKVPALVGDASLADAAAWVAAAARQLGFPISPDPARPPEQLGVNWIDHAIYVNPNRSPAPDVLWDLLHELGHVLQGRRLGYTPKRDEESYMRERDAWWRGWRSALEVCHWLKTRENEYLLHARGCLASYDLLEPVT